MRNEIKTISNTRYGSVRIVEIEEVYYICMQDICQLFTINIHDARAKIDSKEIKKVKMTNDRNKEIKFFITLEAVHTCLFMSPEPKADNIFEWIRVSIQMRTRTNGEYTIDELKEDEIAYKALKKIEELESQIEVYKKRVNSDNLKIKILDDFFGSKKPLFFPLIVHELKYSDLSERKLLEVLRQEGVFGENNFPFQTYVDSKHFRMIAVTTMIGSEEITKRKVLVYGKGIRLIEKILERRAGLNARK